MSPLAALRGACLLATLSFVSTSSCGNYCGAWMCGGASLVGGATCDYDVTPAGTGDDACVDACCRTHDQCCDDEDRAACNTQIADCLARCDPGAASCLYGVVPVSAWLMESAFRVVSGWCCNGPC